LLNDEDVFIVGLCDLGGLVLNDEALIVGLVCLGLFGEDASGILKLARLGGGPDTPGGPGLESLLPNELDARFSRIPDMSLENEAIDMRRIGIF